MTKPLEFFTWSTPNGWKVAIALFEMALPFQLVPVNINKGDQFDDAYLAVSPNGKIPAIRDHDGPGGETVTVFESGAILQYLARKTGTFYGAGPVDQIAVDQWLMWQMSGLGPIAGQTHHFVHYAPRFDPPQIVPYAQERFSNELRRLYLVLDKHLENNEFMADSYYSIADIATWPWINRHERQQIDLADFPHVKRWFERIGERDAVSTALSLLENAEVSLDGGGRVQSRLFNA